MQAMAACQFVAVVATDMSSVRFSHAQNETLISFPDDGSVTLASVEGCPTMLDTRKREEK
jgi:hypothetical protein